MLGDPKADIRGPSDQGRVRVFHQDRRQIVHIRRQDGAVLTVRHPDAAAVFQRRKTLGDALALGDQRIVRGSAILGRRLRRLDDRFIARAAAEVALQRLLDLGLARFRRFHPQRIKRHHDARRAKPALTAMEIDHRTLDRVQRAIRARQMLDGDDMTAVQRGEEPDAGVDGLVDQRPVGQASDQHGAGPAIALGAAFLGSCQAAVQPQEIQQGVRRADGGKAHVFAIQNKRDVATRLHKGS